MIILIKILSSVSKVCKEKIKLEINSKGSLDINVEVVGKLFNNSIKISYKFNISCQFSFFILIIFDKNIV